MGLIRYGLLGNVCVDAAWQCSDLEMPELKRLLLGFIWYVLLGDVGVRVAGPCSDLEMPELDAMDRDVIVIGFCEQCKLLALASVWENSSMGELDVVKEQKMPANMS